MILQPTNRTTLIQAVTEAHARGEKITGLKLGALDRLLEHIPEDMTVTVEAGMSLAALQGQLRLRGQWLPIDPPRAEELSIGALLAADANGPRRFGYGTIREHLLGLRVVMADGTLIKAGGAVVKNVAGYDLCKLFVGSRGSLGIFVEATFKLRPCPEAEGFVQTRCESPEKAGELLIAVLESALTPVVLDLHNLPLPGQPTGAADPGAAGGSPLTLVAGFAGTREEVDWQIATAGKLGLSQPSSLAHETAFWAGGLAQSARRRSVLPSRVTEALRTLGGVPFVARAGNGVIHYRGGPEPPRDNLPVELMRRVKAAYDPKQILPDLPL